MAGIPTPLAKWVISGTMASGIQDFSTGLWFNPNFSDIVGQSELDDTLLAINDQMLPAFMDGQVTKLWTASDQWNATRLYYYPANTRVASLVSEYNITPIPGTGTANLPKETSLVVSLRTSVPGRSGRGRMYFPACGNSLNSVGLINPLDSTHGLAAALLTAFNALNAAAINPIVASFSKSNYHAVRTLVIDNKPDTQRRRQDKLEPTDVHVTVLA